VGRYSIWNKPLVREYLAGEVRIRRQRMGVMAPPFGRSCIFPNEGWLGRCFPHHASAGPLAPEDWTLLFVDNECAREVKDALASYTSTGTVRGMTQQDDMENWYNLTIASKGPWPQTRSQLRHGSFRSPLHGRPLWHARPLREELQRREPPSVLPALVRVHGKQKTGTSCAYASRRSRREHMTAATLTDEQIRLKYEIESFSTPRRHARRPPARRLARAIHRRCALLDADEAERLVRDETENTARFTTCRGSTKARSP